MTSLMTSYFTFVILLFGQSVVSELMSFTVTPQEVKSPFTTSLDMRYGITDSPSSPSTTVATSLVGRALQDESSQNDGPDTNGFAPSSGVHKNKRASLGADPLRHIASVTISRDGAAVASVSTYTSAKVLADVDRANLQVRRFSFTHYMIS